MTFTRFSCLKVETKHLNNFEIQEIKKNLTFFYTDYKTGEKYSISFYKNYKDEILYIPRYFNRYIDCGIKEELINDITNDGDDIDIEDNITPKNKIQEEAIQAIVNNQTGLIKLPPGKGKTVIAIKAASIIKKKFIIVVDMEKIKNQWISELKKFTNLTDDDIGIIQGDKIDIKNKKCCIVMIGTLSSKANSGRMKEYLDILNENNFGLCFYDEVHVLVGPDKFTTSLLCIPCKRTFGLSATPNRTDGRLMLLHYWLGDIIYERSEYDIMPYINIIKFDSGISKTKTFNYIMFSGTFNRMRYNQQIIKSDNYLKVIDDIVNFVIKENRICIFMAEVKKVLNFFIDKYFDKLGGNENIGLFVGGSETSEMYKKYVFTTYKMTSKAIDNVHWDCLIFLTPMGSPIAIEQSIGRTTRYKENKRKPLIFDLVDTSFPILERLFISRYNLYKQKNFEYEIRNFLD